MDYFVSSKLLEPAQAQDHYSERLILLSRLPAIYEEPASSAISTSRQSLGLPEGHLLMGIPQSLFKFHPDFDLVLEAIMVRLPDARIVLVEDKTEYQTRQLKQRWSRYAPHALSKSIFLARISREKFLGLLDTIDLLLDPIYFGSGNTFYEAMAFGTPIVTYTGETLSGRVVSGGYSQMKVLNPPVANSIDAYVELCVKLGSDRAMLKKLKTELRMAAQNHLFYDEKIAEEFGVFFCASVEASRQGRRLPPNWQPAHAERAV
jgi:predicted O-linked N-acetylglucosamine transferase (SPINDLY family)